MRELSGASRPAVFRIPLACDLAQVRPAARAAHQFLAEQECDDETLMACELALVEGCNNAIRYAAPAARTEPVLLEVICEAAAVELRVTDHTAGFEWPKAAVLPAADSESGRGLFLMQSLMDSAVYLRDSGENVLVLRKARRAEPGQFSALT